MMPIDLTPAFWAVAVISILGGLGLLGFGVMVAWELVRAG